MTRNGSFRIQFRPATRMSWLQRTAAIVLVMALAVLGFFFLAVALVAGAILATVFLVRLWWLMRKLRANAGAAAYEGDYVVIEHVPYVPNVPNVADDPQESREAGVPGARDPGGRA